ncbi:hypothetical protein BJX66DRAFT_140233 [Aspergillus keveii]|jgi:hypothetical protein|uniref:Uncharacterized protein n=1 Tax=Aspergillus keveii TaxID=714993 RepID=A0ABR4GBE2_9EURO
MWQVARGCCVPEPDSWETRPDGVGAREKKDQQRSWGPHRQGTSLGAKARVIGRRAVRPESKWISASECAASVGDGLCASCELLCGWWVSWRDSRGEQKGETGGKGNSNRPSNTTIIVASSGSRAINRSRTKFPQVLRGVHNKRIMETIPLNKPPIFLLASQAAGQEPGVEPWKTVSSVPAP